MPRASVRIAASEKTGLRERLRAACLTSRVKSSTRRIVQTAWPRSFSRTNNGILTKSDTADRELVQDAAPAPGRYVTAAEDRVPDGATVTVLGWEFWQ